MTRWLWIAALASACGSPAPPSHARSPAASTVAPSRADDPARGVELGNQADALLASDAPADYERPFADKASDRAAARAALRAACDADHHPSCWKLLAIAGSLDTATVAAVERNCRGGDLLSCRALPEGAATDLPGGAGRSDGCRYVSHAPCSADALREECDVGFPASCSLAIGRVDSEEERVALHARATELAQAGCRADLLVECAMARNHWPSEAQLEAAQRRCKLDRSSCGNYARSLERRDRRPDAAAELERACQYGRGVLDCLEVGAGYFDGKYEEPVHGRGQALVDYACGELARARGDKNATTDYPVCKRATNR